VTQINEIACEASNYMRIMGTLNNNFYTTVGPFPGLRLALTAKEHE